MQEKQNIEILWNKIYTKLFGYISKHVKDSDNTNDIIQNTFIKVKDNIIKLKNPAKAEQWIFQIARNMMFDYFREKKKETEKFDTDFEIDSETDYTEKDEIYSKIKTQSMSDYAGFIIKELPEKYRKPVYMADIEGKSMKEVAVNLNLSISGAKSRVQRGRKLIKEIILKCCDVQTDVYGNILDYQPCNNNREK